MGVRFLRRKARAKASNAQFPCPFPDIQVDVDPTLVAGVIDILQTAFHPGPVWDESPAGRKITKEELYLITAAFVFGMSLYDSDKVRQTLDGLLDRVSGDEAIHFGNFGYFTRENVNPEVAPALDRLYQFIADLFSEQNQVRVSRSEK